MENWEVRARELVNKRVAPQGINDRRILEAMARIPRHRFLPAEFAEYAYDDIPLPIGEGQTISQPFIVARMTELLELEENSKVLEVGTGSGYQAALLAEMGMRVTTVERIERLSERAQEVFRSCSYSIRSIIGDGRNGYPPDAPYDGVIVTAGASEVEEAWFAQLTEGGRIVVPLKVQSGMECLLVRRKNNKTEYNDTWYDYCRFVPLLPGIQKKEENTGR